MTIGTAERQRIPTGASPLFARIRVGEGAAVAVFSCYAFLLLVCYYLLKTLREPLLLENGSAELKSYAYAVIAVSLLFVVPLYGVVFRNTKKRQLLNWITLFLVTNLGVFFLLGRSGADIGFLYYVWVGIFGLVMLAQFWAHAAHVFGVERGQRLFPVIMAGAALGGLVGPLLYVQLLDSLGTWNIMLLTMGLLIATCPLVLSMRLSLSAEIEERAPQYRDRRENLLGGFALVLRDRYLLMLAAMAVLLNCINTTGEYMLTDLVVRNVGDQLAAQPELDAETLIGDFYAKYYFSVNILTVVIQIALVGRLFRWIGVSGALLVLPIVALLGYGLILFFPVFSIIRAIKIIENSTDYSLMNTARHALYLPLPVEKKYQGKTAIDTFFWRLGDVVQAGIVFVGLNWAGFGFRDFAVLNILLAIVWLFLAIRIGRAYIHQAEPRTRLNWRAFASGAAVAAVSCVALILPAGAAASDPAGDADQPPLHAPIFSSDAPLQVELSTDLRELCKDPERKGCDDVPATLSYTDRNGKEQLIEATIRVRGRVETADCSLPALFVFFSKESATGTLFENQTMLPLTTHCRQSSNHYEQYVLKEYLAYRIYNQLTDKSLRVRLLRITWRDSRKPDRRPQIRYGFLTEHFDQLAARADAEVFEPDWFNPLEADPQEIGMFALFQYLIGNTDWSVMYGHNVVVIREQDGLATAVPYDFDYSGLVNAGYAVPPPNLPLRNVRQRLFRGFCIDETDWAALIDRLHDERDKLFEIAEEIPEWMPIHQQYASAYLAGFYEQLESRETILQEIEDNCRNVYPD